MENSNKGGFEEGKKCVWIVVALALAVLLAAFWWFSLRPTQIRKQCFKDNGWSAEYYECLMGQGIEFKLQ